MENQIAKLREEIKKYFDPDALVEESDTPSFSPDKAYRVEWEHYRQNMPDLNWVTTRVKVFDTLSNEVLFEFFKDDSHIFHEWVKTDNADYLVCAEILCGGQTVIDLTNRKMSSYADGTDGFIWAEFFPSPDGKTLAVIGCFWACPYEIKIYDFSHPLELPLRELRSIPLIGDDETIDHWLDNRTFITKGIETEYIEEGLADGTVNYKQVSKKEIRRTFSIDDDRCYTLSCSALRFIRARNSCRCYLYRSAALNRYRAPEERPVCRFEEYTATFSPVGAACRQVAPNGVRQCDQRRRSTDSTLLRSEEGAGQAKPTK
jgi:hypothetical protein